jgi:hypothetical protein
MYEFNGWFVLRESAGHRTGLGADRGGIDSLARRLADYRWTASRIDIIELDRQFCLRLTGMMNRNRGESQELHSLIASIARDLPGSYGLLYEWSDAPDLSGTPGDGDFQVHVLERGTVSRRVDPFLSPPALHTSP